MAGWTSGFCEAKGVRLQYLRTGGSKPPVVLLHGLIGSGACWTPVARALEAEFDVILPDARGHGGSDAPLHGYRYEEFAGDVEALIRGLGLPSPILVGHSMGGMTAALVASRGAVKLRGLLLVDPTFISPEWQREVRDSDVTEQHRRALTMRKEELVAEAKARQPHRSLELLELLAEARLRTRMAPFDVLTPPNPDYRQVVSSIQVPTLLVIGDKPVVSPETAEELRQLNPRLRVEQLEGAGHGVPYDQPERLAAAIEAFARDVTSP